MAKKFAQQVLNQIQIVKQCDEPAEDANGNDIPGTDCPGNMVYNGESLLDDPNSVNAQVVGYWHECDTCSNVEAFSVPYPRTENSSTNKIDLSQREKNSVKGTPKKKKNNQAPKAP